MIRTSRMGAMLALAALLATPTALAGGEQEAKTKKLAKNMAPSSDVSSLPLAPINTDYRIGVNDALDVHVWREPELSRVVPVRPDGKISLPLVGELVAEGRTALELRDIITERLKTYVTAPEVTVIVQQINSQRYFVMGQVASPGVYPLTVPTTVLQALSMAGGFQQFADRDNIIILRRTEDDRTERIRFSYKDWIKKKKVIQHLELKNGDIIVVP